MPIQFEGQDIQEHQIELVRIKEEEEAAKQTAERFHLPYANLAFKPIQREAIELIEKSRALNAKLAVILKNGNILTVAIGDPNNPYTKTILQELNQRFAEVHTIVVSAHSLKKAWSVYPKPDEKKAISGQVDVSVEALEQFQEQITSLAVLRDAIAEVTLQNNVSVIVEILLASALSLHASDIHVEPEEGAILLRLRIDGLMHDITRLEAHAYRLLLSRIKLLSQMKLNIHHAAQDGRFSVVLGETEIQIRSSILPGEYGENIVLRVLNPASLLSLEALGIRKDLLKIVDQQIQRPNGMILTTGPTGSGKTTTLYAFLKKLQRPEVKIITVEDPIEYHLSGISQTQVSPDDGYTFATGLRAILRQDPDIILVGEVRDLETADTALQAALTGHLVLSTLHTNDAGGVVPRMTDIGASPATIGPALNMAIAQRLLRKVCKQCSSLRKVTAEELGALKKALDTLPKNITPGKELGPDLEIAQIKGCEVCGNSGYKGRVGIFEILVNSPEFEKLILQSPSIEEIREFATARGMTSLLQDGLLKVAEGVTTIEEVKRIAGGQTDVAGA